MSNGIKWTQTQEQAITERDTDLLVSASAGSGKTAVMIERITSMIVRREASIDSILVLTFTKESANDMRAKLRVRLEKELNLAKSETDREYLMQQLNALPVSAIGTFHSFCSKLITTNFNVLGIDPGFQILDSVEAKSLKNEVLDEIIAASYDECSEAVDVFCVNRNTERLKEIITSIKEPFLDSRADADAWLETTAFAGYNKNLNDNPAMKQILEYYRSAGEYYLKEFGSCEITASAEKLEKLAEIIKRDWGWAQRLAQCGSYDDLHNFALAVSLDALNKGIGKKERDCSVYQDFKATHSEFKDLIGRIIGSYSVTEEQMLENQERDRLIVAQVIMLVKKFSEAYLTYKTAANKLDYSDLEKNAMKLLGEPSICASCRAKYKFIFVDEYQDTNPMQEKLLSLIGDESKIFMVGDVKQSIYGFRGCEPTIFAGKITDFETNLLGKVVKLNENFRSNPAILEFVNCVFSKIMSGGVAGIDYKATSEFELRDPYPFAEPSLPAVEVLLVDTAKPTTEKKQADDVYDITKDSESAGETKALQAEAALVAEKIFQYEKMQIWNAREKRFQKVRLSDITILTRRKDDFKVLLDVFKKAGIDATVRGEQNAVDLFEIALLNNMLLATSNFYNDVPMVLLMQSFVFGFKPDDLAKIALCSDRSKKDSFYKKMQSYIKTFEDELSRRLRVFTEFLKKYHGLGKREGVVDVLTRFVTEFRIIDTLLAVSTGDIMVQNIYGFLNKLRGQSYAATVAGYVFALESGALELTIGAGTLGGDCVQIMTMHGAKGLEWPIVILFNMGASFNSTDTRKFIVVDKQCGLCVYSTDTDEFVKTNSIARLGAAISGERVLVAEELRLFYVALTRAKNHLFIVGSANIEKLSPECEEHDIGCAKSYLQFLAPTVLRPVRECDFTFGTVPLTDVTVKSFNTKGRVLGGKHDEELTARLREIFSQEYGYTAASRQVLKNSVSSLTKREEDVIDFKPFQTNSCDRGAEYGTHFHKLMQRADFEKPEENANNDVRQCIEIIKPFVKDAKIFKEVPFLQQTEKDGAQILVQGVIDLLAVWDGRVALVDYKTTKASESKLIEIYTPQLEMYAAAVRIALRTDNVETYIYSTLHKKMIRI